LDFRHGQVLASKASREQSSSRLPQESICFAAFDLVNLYAEARGYPWADQSMQQRPAHAATQDAGQAPKGRIKEKTMPFGAKVMRGQGLHRVSRN